MTRWGGQCHGKKSLTLLTVLPRAEVTAEHKAPQQEPQALVRKQKVGRSMPWERQGQRPPLRGGLSG